MLTLRDAKTFGWVAYTSDEWMNGAATLRDMKRAKEPDAPMELENTRANIRVAVRRGQISASSWDALGRTVAALER